MNLLCYDFSNREKVFYFNNIEFKKFIESFPDDQYIVINKLFAHNSIKEYDEHDFSKNITIAELKKFKDQNRTVLIDKINFTNNFIQVNISDEYEYIITAAEPYFTVFINRLYRLIKIDSDIWRAVQENTSKYILIKNGKIVCVFCSFDEYLQSSYSSVL